MKNKLKKQQAEKQVEEYNDNSEKANNIHILQ